MDAERLNIDNKVTHQNTGDKERGKQGGGGEGEKGGTQTQRTGRCF